NLTIVNVTRYDKGPFSCHVYNPVSNGTSEPINFNVSYGPENLHLEISPLLEHYKEGSNVTLTCLAVSRPPAQFTLLLNGGLQSDTGPQFNLTTIQESQSGNYSCQAFNSKTLRYESSSPAVISVLIPVSNLTATASNTDLVEFNSS
ncbi:carcinoembryonic antigen-related cell adhesion molecule 1-like, partial [Plectropomus leopardus]